jgi:protease secretion system outer membrane protein
MMQWTAMLAGCTLGLLSSGTFGAGLLDAYQAARQNDPTFKAARYEREAGQYAIAIGRAGLLPNLSVTGSYSQNRGERDSTTVNLTQKLDYNDTGTAIILRQPLFNYDSFVRYQQGGVQAAYSDAVFDRKEAELAVKVSGAYLDALLAMDRLALPMRKLLRTARSVSSPSGDARGERARLPMLPMPSPDCSSLVRVAPMPSTESR